MKYKFLLFLSTWAMSAAVIAQTTDRIGRHATITNWTVPENNPITSEQGRQLAEKIIEAVGLQPNFEIQPANIENAAAVTYRGRRYILYNPTFISNLIKTTGTEWAAISVLAHEIGHHLNGHTVSGIGSQPAMELEADEFSGFVLRKMGATLAQAQAAMKTLATADASRTHPAQYDRLTSIGKGWSHADDQLAGRTTPKAPEVVPQKTNSQMPNDAALTPPGAVADNRNILGDVFFTADPSAVFYVTANYNLVKVSDGGLRVLGKLAPVNSSQFPYLIYDAQNTQLLVDRTGNIITRTGKQVGYLRNHNG